MNESNLGTSPSGIYNGAHLREVPEPAILEHGLPPVLLLRVIVKARLGVPLGAKIGVSKDLARLGQVVQDNPPHRLLLLLIIPRILQQVLRSLVRIPAPAIVRQDLKEQRAIAASI